MRGLTQSAVCFWIAAAVLLGWLSLEMPGFKKAAAEDILSDPHCGSKLYLPQIMVRNQMFESEDNDSVAEANGPLKSGLVYQGFPDDFEDYFYFDADDRGEIVVDLTDFNVADGQLIIYHETTANQVGFAAIAPYRVEFSGPAGRYYVRVVSPIEQNSVDRYSLAVSFPAISDPIHTLSFVEHFCGSAIDGANWDVGTGDPANYFSFDIGRIQPSPKEITACENGWCQHQLHARDQGRFSIFEMKGNVTGGSDNGLIGINTSCTIAPYTTLVLELHSDEKINGRYTDNSGQLIDMGWEYPLVFGRDYEVRLVQDGDVVRVFINGGEIFPSFPCSGMGDWLNFGVGSSPGGSVTGAVDYIKLWREGGSGVTAAGYDFEENIQNWVTSEGAFKLATLETATSPVKNGAQSLKLTTLLNDASDINRHTEAVVYFDSSPPTGISSPGPYDLGGRTVSCWVYVPAELANSGGNPEIYMRIFSKDSQNRNQFGPAVDITPAIAGSWRLLEMQIGGAGADPGYEAAQVNAMGVRFDVYHGATIDFTGEIFIDHCLIGSAR